MDLFGARAESVASIPGTLYTGAAPGDLPGPVAAGAVFDRAGSWQLCAGDVGLPRAVGCRGPRVGTIARAARQHVLSRLHVQGGYGGGEGG